MDVPDHTPEDLIAAVLRAVAAGDLDHADALADLAGGSAGRAGLLESVGPPPRPGLVFDRSKHRWVRPEEADPPPARRPKRTDAEAEARAGRKRDAALDAAGRHAGAFGDRLAAASAAGHLPRADADRLAGELAAAVRDRDPDGVWRTLDAVHRAAPGPIGEPRYEALGPARVAATAAWQQVAEAAAWDEAAESARAGPDARRRRKAWAAAADEVRDLAGVPGQSVGARPAEEPAGHPAWDALDAALAAVPERPTDPAPLAAVRSAATRAAAELRGVAGAGEAVAFARDVARAAHRGLTTPTRTRT